MSIICDECDGRVCRENPERCNPNMTAAEKLEAIKVNEGKPQCPCESEAIHESYEFGEINVVLDIDIKGEGLIRIRAVEKEKPIPKQAGYAVVCNYCPVCGRKLKEE